MYNGYHVSVVIAAAGMSNRMGSKINKQFLAIDNKPILAHSIEKFEKCKYIDLVYFLAVCFRAKSLSRWAGKQHRR